MKSLILVISMMLYGSSLWGQRADTLTYTLPEVMVMQSMAVKSNPLEEPPEVSPVTSDLLEPSLDYISSLGGALIQYGAGQLATMVWHGLPGSETGIYWNDLAVNDPLTGQSDISGVFLPLMGHQIAWSPVNSVEGLPGGQLTFNSIPDMDSSGNIARLAGQWGQYGLGTGLGAYTYADGHKAFSLCGGAMYNKNAFPYTENGQTKILTHGERQFFGTSVSTQVALSNHWTFDLSTLGTYDDKNVPPRQFQSGSDAHLSLGRSMLTTGVVYNRGPSEWMLRTSASNLATTYFSPSAKIDFSGTSRQGKATVQYRHQFDKHIWETRVSWGMYAVRSTGFAESLRFGEVALASSMVFVRSNTQFHASFHQQVSTLNRRYLTTYFLAISHALQEWGTFRWALGRYGRVPSLNDLYWEVGGMPDLRPEKGWGADARLKLRPAPRASLDVSLFHRRLNDYIQWLPRDGVFYAVNIPSIWTRGGVLKGKYEIVDLIRISCGYTYSKSTYTSYRIPNDDALGKQLIYVPRHQGINAIQGQFGAWLLEGRHQWSGRRYVTSDNQVALKGYHVLDIHWRYTRRFMGGEAVLGGGVENVTNAAYQVVQGWLLPGRVFKLSMEFKI